MQIRRTSREGRGMLDEDSIHTREKNKKKRNGFEAVGWAGLAPARRSRLGLEAVYDHFTVDLVTGDFDEVQELADVAAPPVQDVLCGVCAG